MSRTSLPTLAGLLVASLMGASGCATLSNGGAVFRGQDAAPLVDPPADPQVQGAIVDPPIAPPVEPGQGPAPAGQPIPDGAQHQPGPQAYEGYHGGEYCPPGGTYPAMVIGGPGYGGGGCPGGYCGNGLDWYPRHHHTYSYTTPRCLRYPPPNMPAGAIVYPYYTLRGPSDFFRQK